MAKLREREIITKNFYKTSNHKMAAIICTLKYNVVCVEKSGLLNDRGEEILLFVFIKNDTILRDVWGIKNYMERVEPNSLICQLRKMKDLLINYKTNEITAKLQKRI